MRGLPRVNATPTRGNVREPSADAVARPEVPPLGTLLVFIVGSSGILCFTHDLFTPSIRRTTLFACATSVRNCPSAKIPDRDRAGNGRHWGLPVLPCPCARGASLVCSSVVSRR